MKTILQLATSFADRPYGDIVAKALRERGYEVYGIEEFDVDPKEIVILLFSANTDKEDLLAAQPWLKQQFDYSSFKGFRLMPLLVYSSSEQDPEELFEGELGELVEGLISGEFKPVGFDLDDPGCLKEFDRILEESYSE